MIDFVTSILDIINQQLGHATVVRALVLSMLISGGLTQLAKFSPSLNQAGDAVYRFLVRVFAFLSAFVSCWALWPKADSAAGISAAVVVGLFSPTVYAVVVNVLVWKWPKLDAILSGRPDPGLTPPKG